MYDNNVATEACIAKRQRDIGDNFIATLEKLDVINTRSMNDHDIAYDSLCSAGLIESKLLVVASIKTSSASPARQPPVSYVLPVDSLLLNAIMKDKKSASEITIFDLDDGKGLFTFGPKMQQRMRDDSY